MDYSHTSESHLLISVIIQIITEKQPDFSEKVISRINELENLNLIDKNEAKLAKIILEKRVMKKQASN